MILYDIGNDPLGIPGYRRKRRFQIMGSVLKKLSFFFLRSSDHLDVYKRQKNPQTDIDRAEAALKRALVRLSLVDGN